METTIEARFAGTVDHIYVEEGEAISSGDLLLEVKEKNKMRGEKNEAIFGPLLLFLTVLLIGYLEPVFFPAEKNQPKQLKVGAYLALTPLFLMKNCQLLATQAYIGKDVETFIRQFGNPKEKIKTGRTYELWTFGLTMNDYLEVNVREK